MSSMVVVAHCIDFMLLRPTHRSDGRNASPHGKGGLSPRIFRKKKTYISVVTTHRLVYRDVLDYDGYRKSLQET